MYYASHAVRLYKGIGVPLRAMELLADDFFLVTFLLLVIALLVWRGTKR